MVMRMSAGCICCDRVRRNVADSGRERLRVRPVSRSTWLPPGAQPPVLIDQHLLSSQCIARQARQDRECKPGLGSIATQAAGSDLVINALGT
jgi:hypothetical protein